MAHTRSSPSSQGKNGRGAVDASRHAPGDDRELVPVEGWMLGRTIVGVADFTDDDGQRWRQLTLDNGAVVQTLFSAPWLILADD